VHPATRGKYVRNGFLKARELEDSRRTIYLTVFLLDENKEFLKKHPKITIKTTGTSGTSKR